MELTKYKLGELLDIKRGASLTGEYYATEGEYVRLTCGNFDYVNNCFKENTSKDNLFYTGKVREEFIMQKGDIITPLTEQAIGLLGSTAIIPESNKYIQSQDVAKIICNEELLYPMYAFYLISSASVKAQLGAAAQQTKIRHTSPDKIKDCVVWIPDLADQRRIASVLSNIDKKIALNRQINANLEALAKQLYDYWFVQFDFPDANGKPYKSSGGKMVYNEKLKRHIPDGWELKNIFDAVDVLYGFPFNADLFTTETTTIPVIRIRDIFEGNISTYTTECVNEKYRLHEKDVVIGMDGNFHMGIWHNNDAYLNQRCVRLRANEKTEISAIQILYTTQPYIKYREKTIIGSTVGHLSDKDMKALYILVPVGNKYFAPRKTMDSITQQIIENKKQITSLTKQRDELLPLLMNGQVKVE